MKKKFHKRKTMFSSFLLGIMAFMAFGPFSLAFGLFIGIGTFAMGCPDITKHIPFEIGVLGENPVLTEAQKEEALMKKIKDGIEVKWNDLIKSDPKFTALMAMHESLKTAKTQEEIDAIKTSITTMATEFKTFKETPAKGEDRPLSIGAQLAVEYRKAALAGKIYDLKGGSGGEVMPTLEKGNWLKLNAKAVGTITTANVTASVADGIPFTLSDYLPGYVPISRRNPFVVQLCNVFRTAKMWVQWVEVQGPEGGAGTTAEGGAKTEQDFDLQENKAQVKKITSYIKVSKESLDDIPYMESLIKDQLMELVILKLDVQVLNGDNTGNNLNGITTQAPAFSAGTFANAVDNANLFDVLRVACNQIRIATGADSNFSARFEPNYIVLHPSDVAAMDLAKATTQGQYLIPPFLTEKDKVLDGCVIVANTGMTQGKFLVGDFTRARVGMREDANIAIGYENDDFTKNLVTILCETRAVAFIPQNDLNAFVYGTFSTALASLKDAKS